MKKLGFILGVVLLLSIGASGCATAVPAGALYTDVSFPGGVGDGTMAYTKVGVAKSNSFFGLVAVGDASIKAAAENGEIHTIKYVDYKSSNILGIMGEYTTTVYGD